MRSILAFGHEATSIKWETKHYPAYRAHGVHVVALVDNAGLPRIDASAMLLAPHLTGERRPSERLVSGLPGYDNVMRASVIRLMSMSPDAFAGGLPRLRKQKARPLLRVQSLLKSTQPQLSRGRVPGSGVGSW